MSRQTVNEWVHRVKPVTDARQAQIAVTLEVKASDYFDDHGYAI